MSFEPWQWALIATAAMLVGVAKAGIAGLGILFVVMFSMVIPAKEATGVVLPLLCLGDLVAVVAYRRHANWSHLWRLFPWAAAGLGLGWFAMGRIDNRGASLLIGAIVVVLVALHVWRRHGRSRAARAAAGSDALDAAPRWFAPTIGVLAGFTTLVANAAGPLMAIYLLAMRLPKMEFVGTSAVFFLLINWFKVPFMTHLGLINETSLMLNLKLAPAVLAGTILGRTILRHVDQRWFENLALALSALAGLRMLLPL
jgi:uncharacterized membrane protein YfcA